MLDVASVILTRRYDDWRAHYPRREDEWWATDLTRCSEKREIEIRYPELTMRAIGHMPFVIGEMVHRSIYALVEARCIIEEVECLTEPEYEKLIDIGGPVVKLRYRPDIVLTKDGRRSVLEVKYVRSLKGIPHDHHLEQLSLYEYLLGCRDGALLYVSPEGMCQVEDTSPVDEKWVVDRIVDYLAPRYDWECAYCLYRDFCQIWNYKRVEAKKK